MAEATVEARLAVSSFWQPLRLGLVPGPEECLELEEDPGTELDGSVWESLCL